MDKKLKTIRISIADLLKNKTKFYYVGIGVLLVICLILVNYLIGKRIMGGSDFLFNWIAARNLLLKGINPYAQETISSYLEMAGSFLIEGPINGYHFVAPLYSLFFYLPLAYISDFFLARAIWMALMEVALFACGFYCFKVLNWDPPRNIKIIIFGFSFLFYFSLINLFNGSSLILTNLFFILGLLFLNNERYELSGIFFALVTINIHIFLFPLICVLICALRKRAWSLFIWFVILLFLFGIAGGLFISDWPLQNIKQIINNIQETNFQMPGGLIRNWITGINPNIGNILVLLLFLWLIFEWSYFFSKSSNYLWIICFTISISFILFLQNSIQAQIVLFLPLIYIIDQWNNRNEHIGYLITLLVSTLFSIGLIILELISKSLFGKENYFPFFYSISPVFILINLYWVKWWVNKPLPYDHGQTQSIK